MWIPLACAATACQDVVPDADLERMIDQAKAQPYEADQLVPDESAMRSPPAGTVLHARPELRRSRVARPEIQTGIGRDGEQLARIPLAVTSSFVARGRERFEIYCATCHGVAGDGKSEVARHMDQRKPPDLMVADVRGFSDGRIFRVIGAGYGLMPAYDRNLEVEDRWAVVAYLRALQLSQAVSLDALPADLRRLAEAELR